MKIVLIGAASRSFGRGQIADVLRAEELKGPGVTLSLVDTDANALDLMARAARRMKEHTASDVAIESATDRRPAGDVDVLSPQRRARRADHLRRGTRQ